MDLVQILVLTLFGVILAVSYYLTRNWILFLVILICGLYPVLLVCWPDTDYEYKIIVNGYHYYTNEYTIDNGVIYFDGVSSTNWTIISN